MTEINTDWDGEDLQYHSSNRIFFILGIRRSGTSILKTLLSQSPEIEEIKFEPHTLWHSVQMLHFKRLRAKKHEEEAKAFESTNGKWIGAKFALNPGIDAFDYFWLEKVYPEAKFIIIARDTLDTWQSYLNLDKNIKRGALPYHIYSPMANWLLGVLYDFARHKKDKCVLIKYENLIKDADEALKPVWNLLGIPYVTGLQKLIKPKTKEEKEVKWKKLM